MKIETKFDVGQTVWWRINDYDLVDGQIEAIIYRGGSVFYNIADSGCEALPECEIFLSEKEARKSMLTRHIQRIKRLLEAYEHDLAELKKKEQTNDAE